MDIKLQVFILTSCIVMLYFIIDMIKKEKLELKYTLLWIIINISIIILCIFPKLIDLIAKLLGIVTPVNAIFFFGITFEILITLSLTVAQSRSSKKLKDLAQEIALLESKKMNAEDKG